MHTIDCVFCNTNFKKVAVQWWQKEDITVWHIGPQDPKTRVMGLIQEFFAAQTHVVLQTPD